MKLVKKAILKFIHDSGYTLIKKDSQGVYSEDAILGTIANHDFIYDRQFLS